MTYPEHVVLVSGGLDSLLVWACQRPHATPVFARLGHPYEAAERLTLATIRGVLPDDLYAAFVVRECRRIDATDLMDASGFLPLRNLLLVAAVVAEGASDVALGSTCEDVHADNRPAFRRDYSHLLSHLLAREVTVSAPLWHATKAEAIGYALGTRPELLPAIRRTRSCYALEPRHVLGATVGCGVCRACQRRRLAWEQAQLPADIYDSDEGGR